MAENKRNQDTNLGQQSNQNWDESNDQQPSGSSQPNPERFQDANLGQGQSSRNKQDERADDSSGSEDRKSSGGSAFNERHESTVGAGTSKRSERENFGPLDADLADLPSEKRSGNQTGPGLG